MKKLFMFVILTVITSFRLMAADAVKFYVNEGVENNGLKKQIEQNVTALLTSLNAACKADKAISYAKSGITDEAKQQIDMLWMNVHFFCEDEEIVERVLTTANGFQVRNIPLTMKALAGETLKDEYQEAVINIDKTGKIVSFFFTISMNMYTKVMQNSNEVSDVRRRMTILDYVEHFRTAYNMKDMPFLQQVFSDDALIITGKVIKVQKSDMFPAGNKIIYKKQNKQQYLTNLGNAFKVAKYIKVKFDDIKIVAHPTKDDIYGVTLHQEWNTNTYNDEGYVFMLWDFTNEDEPKIHVRTWQPDYLDKTKGERINPDDIFSLSDFVL
ncbi:MAG: nuclear transport factor 2 family protein [Bacteroidaceae bacterium]|nr:nuclear transport factor 2 family protein [Bacteroidaceae bacterium]